MRIREFIEGEEGIGTVELVLILVIILALVVMFREKIQKIVTDALKQVDTDAKTIMQ